MNHYFPFFIHDRALFYASILLFTLMKIEWNIIYYFICQVAHVGRLKLVGIVNTHRIKS